jgi:hypothetical protein
LHRENKKRDFAPFEVIDVVFYGSSALENKLVLWGRVRVFELTVKIGYRKRKTLVGNQQFVSHSGAKLYKIIEL